MRTPSEIVEQVRQIRADAGRDIFGVEAGDLAECLSFDDVKLLLKPEAVARPWGPVAASDDAAVVERLKGYMPFAWDKANNCRGLSALRSLSHMRAWVWLLGEDAVADILGHYYDRYGKPHLAAICERYGIDWRKLDNGHWRDDEFGPDREIAVSALPWRPRQ